MASDSKKQDKKSPKGKTPEEILQGFQMLRVDQRNLANKLSKFELDLNEHKMVIDTLESVEETRKCYRKIGGVLCERTVKDVLPVLQNNKVQLTKVMETMTEQLAKKGVEINEYKEKHKLRIRGQDDIPETEVEEKSAVPSTSIRGNVLVDSQI